MDKFSEEYYKAYQNLPEKLAEQYSDLNFENHCYLRIALDNTFEGKWDTFLKRPAYKNLSDSEKSIVRQLLKSYESNKSLLLEHNKNSLKWRKK